MPDLFDDDVLDSAPAVAWPLFFALYPDAETVERLERLFDDLGKRFGLTGATVQNFHMTLFQPGPQARLTRDERAAALEAGDRLRAAPFEVQLDQVVTLPNKRPKPPIVLRARDGLPAWLDLQRRLGITAVAAGAVRTMPRYAPHLTLTYDKHHLEPIEIEPIRWTVRSFALVRSHFGEGVHEPLRQWDLHDVGGVL
jgi:2'-5' RNA ligase